MSFSRPIQWYHFHEDPIWPDGIFKEAYTLISRLRQSDPFFSKHTATLQYLEVKRDRQVASCLCLLMNQAVGAKTTSYSTA